MKSRLIGMRRTVSQRLSRQPGQPRHSDRLVEAADLLWSQGLALAPVSQPLDDRLGGEHVAGPAKCDEPCRQVDHRPEVVAVESEHGAGGDPGAGLQASYLSG